MKFDIRPIRIALLLSLAAALSACERQATAPGGDDAPRASLADLSLPNLRGGDDVRAADFKGKTLLAVFLRTDDAPCRAAVADWNALQAEFAPRGFAVVGIAIDDRPPAALASEAAALSADFPLALADAPTLDAFEAAAPVRALPTAFLFDRSGLLLRTYPGFDPLELLRLDIDAALDDRPLPSLDSNPATEEDA
jgi:cytochrome c biogenesis protein CcmG, thiol:disulfide interchange protein DsbE